MSSKTRHALKVIHDYLAGENEAVQYCLTFMADEVTQTTSGIVGGIQAGAVPSNQVVSDSQGQVFSTDPSTTGSSSGSLSLNLHTGHLDAGWTVNGNTVNISGAVHSVESLSSPSDRFLFVIEEPGSGFYVLSTTNI